MQEQTSVADIAFGPAPDNKQVEVPAPSPTPFRHLLAGTNAPKRIPMEGAYVRKEGDAPLPALPAPTPPVKPPAKVIQASVPAQPVISAPNLDILKALMDSPTNIRRAQEVLDQVDRQYKRRLAALTIQAFSAPLFPGKKDGEPNRCASNDTEREAAIAHFTLNSDELNDLLDERDDALHILRYEQNLYESVKLIAQLTIATAK